MSKLSKRFLDLVFGSHDGLTALDIPYSAEKSIYEAIVSTAGASLLNTQVAGEVLGGHRLVNLINGELFYASSDSSSNIGKLYGMTTQAAELGTSCSVLICGDWTEFSWNWDVTKKLYLGTNGVIVQDPPSSGFILNIGLPITSISVSLRIESPIILLS